MGLLSILRAWEPEASPVLRMGLLTSPGLEEAPAEQLKAGAAVHLALQRLQPVDLALDLAIAPPQRQGGPHSRFVLHQARREATQLPSHSGPLGVRHPGL